MLPLVQDDTSPRYREANSAVAVALDEWVDGPEYTGELGQIFTGADEHSRREMSRVMRIDFGKLGHAAQQQTWVRNNVRLIKSVSFERLEAVRATVEESVLSGERHEGLRDKLIAQFGVTKSRASLIARDQTLKLTSQLNQQRATSVGVQTYTWITSRDERVRPGHKALDGTIQRYDSPPITNPRTGERNHAGFDYQCRCVAAPNTDELLGIDEVQEAAGVPLPEPPKPAPLPVAPAPVSRREKREALASELRDAHARALPKLTRHENGRYSGKLPDDYVAGVKAQADHVRETLGLPVGRGVKRVVPVDVKDTAASGYMGWDGELQLAIGALPPEQRLIAHETIHSMGGVGPGAYRGHAVKIEEAVTEHLAQDYVGQGKGYAVSGRLLPIGTEAEREAALAALDAKELPQIKAAGSSYASYRQDIKAVIAAGKGTADADQVHELFSAAAKRWKQKTYETKEQAIQAFIHALQPAGKSELAWYKLALRDRKTWPETSY